ncbi:MAG: hypothetical protein K9I82_16560 [Chitinophagaceae bacterium]|nr:hypothetical protein [Chitinophagaceae bacterium]
MEQPKRNKDNSLFSILVVGIIAFVVFISGNYSKTETSNIYVKPYHTRTGRLVKAHARKSVSISPNAVKRQNYSKAYYQRHKSRYTKSKQK